MSRKSAFLLIGILMAQLAIDLQTIGHFEILLFLGMVFSFFWTEPLIKAYLSRYRTWNEENQRGSIKQIYFLFVAVSLGMGLLFLAFESIIVEVFAGGLPVPHYRMFLMYLMFIQPAFLIPFLYQLQGNKKGILAFAIFIGLGHVIAVTVPLALGYNLGVSVQCLVIIAVLAHVWILLSHILQNRSKSGPLFSSTVLGIALPLVGYSLVQSFTGVFDSWLINWFYQDYSTFAIFRYGARELPLVLPLIIGLSNLALPLLSQNPMEGRLLIKVEGRKLMHLLFPLTIALLITSEYFFPIVFNPSFTESARIFNIYLLLVCSQLLFPQTLITALGRTKLLFYVAIIEVLINVALSFILVHSMGMEGVALATVFAYLIEKVLLIAWLAGRANIKPSAYSPVRLYLGYTTITVLCFVYVMYC